MTLIVSIITNRSAFIICDKMHSLDGADDKPVEATAKIGEITIHMKSPKIRINSGTKIYKINDNVYIGGAGDYNKIQEYIKTTEGLNESNIVLHTYQYFRSMKNDSPDQLLILYKQSGTSNFDAFYKNSNEEFFSFIDCNFCLNDANIGVIAIGSGGPLFLSMYNQIKQNTIKMYKKSIINNTYEKWEEEFLRKVKEMYLHVSKYDDAVSSETEIYKL